MAHSIGGKSGPGGLSTRLLGALALAAGCAGELDIASSRGDRETFEEWRASLPIDDTGAYIVEGDLPIVGDEELLRYFHEERPDPGALTVKTASGAELRWSVASKYDLTYCVSTPFGSPQAA